MAGVDGGDGAIVCVGVACFGPCLTRVLALWFSRLCTVYLTFALALSLNSLCSLSLVLSLSLAFSLVAPFAHALVLQQCATCCWRCGSC